MLNVKSFIFNPVCVNTYLVYSGSEGVIIDCGCMDTSEWSELKDYIDSHSLRISHLLNTHLHLDHVFGNQYATEAYNLKAEANSKDYFLYKGLRQQVSMFFGEGVASSFDYSYTSLLGPSLEEGSVIPIGDDELKVIFTPGHSPGGICFYSSKSGILFSGDTLFQSSIGRTDLDGGDYITLIKSIQTKLMVLPQETKVYSGHGNPTTIGYEQKYNPFL